VHTVTCQQMVLQKRQRQNFMSVVQMVCLQCLSISPLTKSEAQVLRKRQRYVIQMPYLRHPEVHHPDGQSPIHFHRTH